MQVKRHVDSPYFRSDSKKSYKVIKSFFTEREPLQSQSDYTQQENYYSNNSS